MLDLDLGRRPQPRTDIVVVAEDALARLDERLRTSSIRAGWVSRTHFLDAAASLWLDGDLVALEDLVLHDAAMDVRTPTHELTRAHAMLRARRRIAEARPGWAFEETAIDVLLGRLALEAIGEARDPGLEPPRSDGEFAAIDALIARTSRLLGRGSADVVDARPVPPSLDRLDKWRAHLAASTALSPVAAAATIGQAWSELRPIENAEWLGRLLAAEMLRLRAKTRVHLAILNIGLKSVARADRQSRDAATRLTAWVQGFEFAAEAGLRLHDRWLTAREILERKLKGRRSTSRLPRLVDLVLSRPMVTSAMIAKELDISARAAPDLAGELGLREMTGRGRYRAWGIL